MGCASSSPMVATAGSEVLKAATHVATDASKSAEDAAKDVAETLGKTLDSAKETVGTAVTGIAQELGTALKEKTEALDDVKNSLMEKLHLNAGDHTAAATGASEAEEKAATAMRVHEEGQPVNEEEHNVSRAVTPVAHDTDSLRTSTPEPEIEQALANSNEDKPPTPKPTLSEFEQLSAATTAVGNAAATALKQAFLATSTMETAATATTNDELAQQASEEHATEADTAPPVEKTADAEEQRPTTTEWEKYADTLAHSSKFNPLDPYKRGGKLRRFGQEMNTPLPPAHWGDNSRPMPMPMPTAIAHNRLREEESTLSDVNYNSSPLNSTRSSAVGPRRKLPLTLTRNTARKYQRDFASLMGGDKTARPPRAQSKSPAMGRKFDYNPNRARIGSSPTKARSLSRSQVGSPIHAAKTALRSGYTSPVENAKLSGSRVASPVRNERLSRSKIAAPIHNNTLTKVRAHSPINPKVLPRSNLNSPVRARTLMQQRLNSPNKAGSFSASQTHLDSNGLSQTGLNLLASTKTLAEVLLNSSIGTVLPTQLNSPTKTKAHKHSKVISATQERSLKQTPAISPAKADARSRSSRSSTNSSIIIKSPISRSPSKSSLQEENGVQHNNHSQVLGISSVECSRSHTPTLDIYGTGRSTPYSMSHTADRVVNSSSFLSTPRTSPFSIRKQYSDGSDKENQSAFVSDLSSVSDKRLLLSPYKLRDRCAVCHKKYVIK